MKTFSRGDTVHLQTGWRNDFSVHTFEAGKFMRYDAHGNVVVEYAPRMLDSTPLFSLYRDALAIDKRIGLPVELTFRANACWNQEQMEAHNAKRLVAHL